MNKVKKNGGSFVKQAAILAVAGILVRLLGFLYRLPLTNMIGDEGNGIYSAGYYLYNMFFDYEFGRSSCCHKQNGI